MLISWGQVLLLEKTREDDIFCSKSIRSELRPGSVLHFLPSSQAPRPQHLNNHFKVATRKDSSANTFAIVSGADRG